MCAKIALVAAVAVLSAVPVLAAPAAASARSAHAACGGRSLLTCAEKTQSFPDAVNWSHAFVLDGELFETPLATHIHTAALKQFWRFEAAAAGARAEFEFAMASEILDNSFEEVFRAPVLPQPTVKKGGPVSRKLASQMSALMQGDQAEVLSLYSLDVALNRATEAKYERGRKDWMNWQLAVAAGYARRAAAAMRRVSRAQRQVSRGMRRSGLLFGVGSADLRVAGRTVRRYGLARPLVDQMRTFGVNPSLIAHLAEYFKKTSFGPLSFSLPQFIGQPAVLAGEGEFRSALLHFASRIPPAERPPM